MADPRPLRILLIDNDAHTRELLARDLESLGHQVAAAEDGELGVLKAKEDPPPELLVIDLTLDMKGGDQVWREIQADPRTAEVPAIFCSLPGYQTVRRRVGEKPRIQLAKPFRLQELQSAVAAAMATGRAQG